MALMIAHRGNIDGRKASKENDPKYLLQALDKGYEIECDVRKFGDYLYLGHDEPQYCIEPEFFQQYGVWAHCKDVDSLAILLAMPHVNCFYHDKDAFTVTRKGYIWCYPRNYVDGGILVHPELIPVDLNLAKAGGFCSDNVTFWKDYETKHR